MKCNISLNFFKQSTYPFKYIFSLPALKKNSQERKDCTGNNKVTDEETSDTDNVRLIDENFSSSYLCLVVIFYMSIIGWNKFLLSQFFLTLARFIAQY